MTDSIVARSLASRAEFGRKIANSEECPIRFSRPPPSTIRPSLRIANPTKRRAVLRGPLGLLEPTALTTAAAQAARWAEQKGCLCCERRQGATLGGLVRGRRLRRVPGRAPALLSGRSRATYRGHGCNQRLCNQGQHVHPRTRYAHWSTSRARHQDHRRPRSRCHAQESRLARRRSPCRDHTTPQRPRANGRQRKPRTLFESSSAASVFRRPTIGARIAMPFSPLARFVSSGWSHEDDPSGDFLIWLACATVLAEPRRFAELSLETPLLRRVLHRRSILLGRNTGQEESYFLPACCSSARAARRMFISP